MKQRLIPFRLLPASWGLTGRPYLEAEAHYYHEGEALERRLAEIAHAEDTQALTKAMLLIDRKYGHIDEYDFDCSLQELSGDLDPRTLLDIRLRHGRIDRLAYDRGYVEHSTEPGLERELALVEIDFTHGNISKIEAEKRAATLRDEPWIGIVNQDFDLAQGVEGLKFEFDWNAQWIEYLRLNGYVGSNDEQVVEKWFNHLCRSVAEQDAAEGMEAIERAPGRVINRVMGVTGGAEFS